MEGGGGIWRQGIVLVGRGVVDGRTSDRREMRVRMRIRGDPLSGEADLLIESRSSPAAPFGRDRLRSSLSRSSISRACDVVRGAWWPTVSENKEKRVSR